LLLAKYQANLSLLNHFTDKAGLFASPVRHPEVSIYSTKRL
jgi:hypothetical protein